MEESDLEKVIDLASNSKGIAGIQAKNILNTAFGYTIYDDPILPELTEELRINKKTEKLLNQIKAFPNPADQNVQFQYSLDQNYINLSIRIFDSSGTLIEVLPLPDGKEGFLSWNSGKAKDGFYLYSIASNKHNLVTGKLVIAR